MTVKDLINKEGRLCVFYPIDNKHHLFIEGLDAKGEKIYSYNKFETYSTQIKTVRVEVIKDHDDKGEVIDTIKASLSAKVTHLVKKAKTIINKEKEKKMTVKNNIINLNHQDFHLSTLPMGKTQNIRLKVGRKVYLMDADKSALSITVDIYNELSKKRNTFSKYDERANLKSLTFVTDCILTRDLVNNFTELEKAVSMVKKYKKHLDLTW